MNSRKYRLVMTIALAVATIAVLMSPIIVEHISYAVEKGKVRAAREALAKLSEQDRMSPLMATVSTAVRPSVVLVRVKQKVKVPSMPNMFQDPFFRRHFGDQFPHGKDDNQEQFRMVRGQGSGVIVDAEKGYIITNYHVVGNADDVEIITMDDRSLDAEWVRGDQKTDIAVVKIKPENLIASPLGDSEEVKVGQWVMAFGAPMGLPQTVTAGIISAKGRRTDPRMYQNYLQTDAAINRGNSGGPLVNMKGEVIGINTAILSNTGMNAGIGLSIPSNMVKNIMSQLVKSGKVTRGYLGIMLQDVDEGLAKVLKLPGAKGAMVTTVMPDTPASEAGLKEKDFIVSINGKEIDGVDQLRNIVASFRPGTKIKVVLYREGKKKELTIKLGTFPEEDTVSSVNKPEEKSAKAVGKLGLKVLTLTADLAKKGGFPADTKGVVITSVTSDSPAAEVQLTQGEVITEVNNKKIASVKDFAVAVKLAGAKGVALRVVDNSGRKRYVFIKPSND